MKKPFVTAEQLEDIAARYPTPFHLYDAADAADALGHHQLRERRAVAAAALLLQDLKDGGGRRSLHGEIFPVAGIPRKSGFQAAGILADALRIIMFSSNETPAEDYRLAAKLGATINLDDITHVDFLEKTIGYIPKRIGCRFNPGGTFSLGESREGFQVMDNPGDAKYGMTREQITQAFRMLKARGAEEFGIHAFLASNTLSNEYYPALARILFQLAVELQRETGCHITYINLSGGVGIPYRPEESENDIAVIGEGVRKVYEEILVPAGMGDVALCTELGRFMLAPYGHLVTRAIHAKHIYKEYIGTDACACDLMRPAMYGSYHHITVMGKENAPCDHKYDIVGGLCENNDKFAVDRMLPRIDIGDLLVIHDAGAHGLAMGYNYNGKLRCAEVLLQPDGSTRLIRRAETPEDYFATMIWDD